MSPGYAAMRDDGLCSCPVSNLLHDDALHVLFSGVL
jgi:hypothetical protein